MRLVWCTGVAALALLCALAWYLRTLSPGVLALQFAFTPRAFGEVVHQWDALQLARFRSHLPVDGLLLLCYGLFGYLFATRTRVFATWPPRPRRGVAWVLALAAAFDALENVLHAWLTEAPRLGVTWPYLLAAGAASAKWILIVGFGLAVATALAGIGRAGSARDRGDA
ncbi:MAG TPA: hypothetical protein PL196_10840 [Burkholderiaceae bacterium]|nr:hypothetical protein [Burkholderiaceae bacterium]